MSKTIMVHRHGGPEVLEWVDHDPGQPGPGEVLVRHTAIGLNFIDVYHRTGLYAVDPPFTPGVEGAGVVEAAAADVTTVAVGDRVAYTSNGPIGSYSEQRVMPAARLFRLPDSISDETAAAIMVKGCTVEYLVRRTRPIHGGEHVLLTAAAGGVGLIASQWLRSLGAIVIGAVGSEEKAERARASGCDHVILYRDEDIADRVAEITGGRGCEVVLDSVGRSTFDASLASVARRGTLVTFGNASGPVDPVAPLRLAQRGSVFLTRPRLADYYSDPDEIRDGVAALFEVVSSGRVTPQIGARYTLSDAARAHADLEARATVGSCVLVP